MLYYRYIDLQYITFIMTSTLSTVFLFLNGSYGLRDCFSSDANSSHTNQLPEPQTIVIVERFAFYFSGYYIWIQFVLTTYSEQ